MKVVLLNTSSRTGGAAVAAARLLRALRKQGVSVQMCVLHKEREEDWIETVEKGRCSHLLNRIRFYWERAVIFLHNHFNRSQLFRVSIANTGTDISRLPCVREADVIHLHWINQGFLSLNDIKQLAALGKPIVWTMHDMWPSTGICHHARDCQSFHQMCGSCFYLDSHADKDLSTQIYQKKQQIYKKADISFVGCSNWIAALAKKSVLLRGKRVVDIPNPIDTKLFRPADKSKCRKDLSLPQDKRLILFGALNVTDERKGVNYLLKALSLLKQPVELVVFGQVKSEIQELVPVPIHSLGYLSDEKKIVSLYNAVDLFVISSLDENLPNMVMEAMACGTPCVGFRTGGIPEMIDHLKNGYVADHANEADLAKGIEWVLEHLDNKELTEACLAKVQNSYAEDVVAKRYMDLYDEFSRH